MQKFDETTITDIQNIIREAGKIAVESQADLVVRYKSDRSPVSDAEMRIEKLIIKYLQNNFPGDQIISEESGVVSQPAARTWVLDPIDGTRVYIKGLPTWGILLGLLEEGKPSLGFFNMAKANDFFWGGPAYGAFRNTTRLPECPRIPVDDPVSFLAVPADMHLHFKVDYPRVRSLGSTAANFCYVAQGSAIGVLSPHINIWDIAGVLPILEATGISYEFLSGASLELSDYFNGQKLPGDVLASHPDLMPVLRGMIHPI